jgi:hypothetical protein
MLGQDKPQIRLGQKTNDPVGAVPALAQTKAAEPKTTMSNGTTTDWSILVLSTRYPTNAGTFFVRLDISPLRLIGFYDQSGS